ncbi:MAG: hypothetical protein EOO38_11210 [Cytophagaceae bacterium]|nr:MAG: hypothetical protein EOO38_11210 [Cytophagaceae bacterium]
MSAIPDPAAAKPPVFSVERGHSRNSIPRETVGSGKNAHFLSFPETVTLPVCGHPLIRQVGCGPDAVGAGAASYRGVWRVRVPLMGPVSFKSERPV